MAVPLTLKSTDLLDYVAAGLSDPSTPDQWFTATLVSPWLVLTVTRGRSRLQIEEGSPRWWNVEIPDVVSARARVLAVDPTFGLALLSLDRPAGAEPPELEFVDEPAPDQPWRALYRPDQPPSAAYASGTVGDLEADVDLGLVVLRLSAQDVPPEPEDALGAPILVGGKFAGLVARVGPPEDAWAALPWRTVAQSSIDPFMRRGEDLDERDFYGRLSPSSRDALNHAEWIRRHLNQDAVHMEHLIAGLYLAKDSGPTQSLFLSVTPPIDASELASIVRGDVETELPFQRGYDQPPLPEALPPLSRHARRALYAASQVSWVHGSEWIRSRHLLFGALSVEDCSVIGALRARGVRKESVPLDDAQAPRVEPVSPAEAGPTTIAGFQADDLRARDRLGVTEEVKALCSVIAAKDVPLPMAVGLFGPWGSGKSYFMGKMEEQINAIRDRARRAGPTTTYCSHIVQLKFNAWHYMDTNIWASLNSELFTRLSWAVTSHDTQQDDFRRARLETRVEAARAKLDKARSDQAGAEVRLSEADATLEEAAGNLSVAAMARGTRRAILGQPAVAAKAQEVAEAINLPAVTAASAELGSQLLELQGLWGRTRLIALSVLNSPARWKWLGVLAAVLLTPVALMFLVPWLTDLGLDTAMARLAGLLLGIAAGLSPFVTEAKRGLDRFQQFIDAVERERQAEIEKLEAERRSLQANVKRTKRATAHATKEVKSLEQRLDNLRPDRRMAEWIRQRKLSDDYTKHLSVVARARDDFEQLSIHLDAVRREVERQRADGKEPEFLPRVDRIVLYIDDLDRCPERVVEEVLQAVYLLLAFPTFVVVVGVDPRWLIHALRRRSPAFRPLGLEADGISAEERRHWLSTPLNYLEKIFQIPFALRPMEPGGFVGLIEDLVGPQSAAGQSRRTDASRDEEPVQPFLVREGATPADGPSPGADGEPAPEAIVPPQDLQPSGSVDLRIGDAVTVDTDLGLRLRQGPGMEHSIIATLPPGTRATVVDGPVAANGFTYWQLQTDEHGIGWAAGNLRHEQGAVSDHPAPFAPAADEAEIDPNPPFLLIEPWEQSFMETLAPLIPSPRAAKRFVNVYRLLKAMVEPRRPEVFRREKGEYRELLLLLALQTGYPAEAAEVFRALREVEPDTAWWDFVLKARSEGGGLAPATDDGAGHWEEVRASLQRVHLLTPADVAIPKRQTCASFKKWSPMVARFSFHSGQALFQ